MPDLPWKLGIVQKGRRGDDGQPELQVELGALYGTIRWQLEMERELHVSLAGELK